MKKLFTSGFLLFLFLHLGISQNKGTLLLISSQECEIIIDGESKGLTQANKPTKYELLEGEHFIEGKANDVEKSEVIVIEANKQKVLKLGFEILPKNEISYGSSKAITPIKVAEINFTIPGGLFTATQSINSSNPSSVEYPKFYYAFEKGDKITADLILLSKKGTNAIEITSYPDGNVIYSNNKFVDLNGFSLTIPKKGIYKFEIGTNHAFDRNARMTILRTPVNEETIDFNTKVVLKRKFQTIPVQDASYHYINSGSNAAVYGGKSRIYVTVKLPPKTVEWYYTISASRNKEDIDRNLQTISLFKDLSEFVIGLNPATTILNIGVDLITKPPGNDFCDVYLLDHANLNQFISKNPFSSITTGTKENVKSAVVKITNLKEGEYYLGIKNPSSMYGVNIGIEVAAITMEEYYDFEE